MSRFRKSEPNATPLPPFVVVFFGKDESSRKENIVSNTLTGNPRRGESLPLLIKYFIRVVIIDSLTSCFLHKTWQVTVSTRDTREDPEVNVSLQIDRLDKPAPNLLNSFVIK